MNTFSKRFSRTHSLYVGLFLGFWALACANTQGRYPAEPITAAGRAVAVESAPNGVRVSAEEVASLSSANLGVVEVTFDNLTEEFVRLTDVSLDFGESLNTQISIPVGEGITSWSLAETMRAWRARPASRWRALSNVSDFANHRQAQLAPTTAIAPTEIEVAKLKEAAPSITGLLPSNHLLAGPFLVPPHLFAKKWILLKSDSRVKTCVAQVVISLQVNDKPVQKLLVRFRDRTPNYSEWQQAQCAPPPQSYELGK